MQSLRIEQTESADRFNEGTYGNEEFSNKQMDKENHHDRTARGCWIFPIPTI